MNATATRRWVLIAGAAMAALAGVVAFAAAARFEFVYDDRWTIVDNRWLRGPLRELLAAAAAGKAQALGIPDHTRPAMVVSMWIDRHLFGLSPGGYHVHSLLLYAASAAAATAAAFAIARDETVAVLAGLFFAIAPLHAEVVAAVNYREDLIAGIGLLIPLAWAFWPGERESSMGETLAVAACWLWGLLGKESAASLPLLLVVVGLALRTDRAALRSRELTLFVLAATAIVWLNWRVALTLGGDGIPRAPKVPLLAVLSETGRFLARSTWTALFPFRSSPEYSPAEPAELAWVLFPVAAAIAIGMLSRRHALRPLAAGLAIAMLAPIVSSPLFRPVNPWADRYLFTSVLGGGLVWGVLGARLAPRIPKIARVPLLATLCAAALVPCFYAAKVWATERTVWTTAVRNAPDSPRAWAALSRVERLNHHLEAADRAVEHAVSLDPGYAPARVTRAYNMLAHGDVKAARREIERLDRLGAGNLPSLPRARLCAGETPENAPRCIGYEP